MNEEKSGSRRKKTTDFADKKLKVRICIRIHQKFLCFYRSVPIRDWNDNNRWNFQNVHCPCSFHCINIAHLFRSFSSHCSLIKLIDYWLTIGILKWRAFNGSVSLNFHSICHTLNIIWISHFFFSLFQFACELDSIFSSLRFSVSPLFTPH